MAMTVGTVTVAGDGSFSGTAGSAALFLMNALDALETFPDPASPPVGVDPTFWANTLCPATKLAIRQSNAKKANGIAQLVTYIQQNADLNFAQNSLAAGVPAPAGGATVSHTQTTPGSPIA